MDESEIDLQHECDRMVRREVIYCLSGLVNTLAKGYGEAKGELGELCEEAFELCTPIDDWCEAAVDHARNDATLEELVEFLSTARECQLDATEIAALTKEQAVEAIEQDEDLAREYCEENRLDPYQREIYEHWAVSNWLARKLKERGEKVGWLDNFEVWARCTTGQAIGMDGVIENIYRASQQRDAA